MSARACLAGLLLLACAELPAAPLASVDLTTTAGVEAVGGSWRYSDVTLVPARFRAAGADGQPSGAELDTYDYTPHAGGADFDDSAWPQLAPESLAQRRGGGRLSFNWYRFRFSVPATLAGRDLGGATLVLVTALDDYAEIWVDGELARAPGQRGGSVVAGWNARNRVTVGYDVQPGQVIQLAIFGINGPISAAPTNYIWLREARLEVHAPVAVPFAVTPQEVNVEVQRTDAALDAIVPANPKLYKLAQGFRFTEGPVWHGEGRLLFSDPNANRIYQYQEPGLLTVFREHSGYTGADIAEYTQPGSNGLTLDGAGRLTVNEHGNRRVSLLEADGRVTVLADNVGGKRLNSPNDLTYRRDGSLYFTDPPFGLPRFAADPRRELDVAGIYRVKDGVTELLAADLAGPNGIAFSPDETFLYVGNWDPARKVVMRYPVRADGRLGAGEVFFDMTSAPFAEAIDGIKVDVLGNLYVAGPGGLWILDAGGRHLGTLRLPKPVHNLAWGGRDGHTLYLTAHDRLYRMDLLTRGTPPGNSATISGNGVAGVGGRGRRGEFGVQP